MTQGSDLPLPTARTLAGWWRELADLRPRRLWFGRLLFHHLDALVETTHEVVLDPLPRALLQAVAADLPTSSFDPQLRVCLLRELTKAGLLDSASNAPILTKAGQIALETGRADRKRTAVVLVRGQRYCWAASHFPSAATTARTS